MNNRLRIINGKVGEGVGFERIRRIIGYFAGILDRFNNAKRAEVKDRVKHADASKGNNMKYFKITEPYGALIAAETEERAIELYVECVADNGSGEANQSIKEISRLTALILFKKTLREDEPVRGFDDEGVLLVDAILL